MRELARHVPGLRLRRWLGAIALVASLAALPAEAALKGDVNEDGIVSALDVLLLQRYLEGEVSLSSGGLDAADVADFQAGGPIGDSAVTAADLLVLRRALAEPDLDGDGLSPREEVQFQLSPLIDDRPTITTAGGATTDNPFTVVGEAPAGQTVRLFVAGDPQAAVTADGNGDFSIAAILDDDSNLIHAVLELGSVQSGASNTIDADYDNQLPRVWATGLSSDTVWTKGDDPVYKVTLPGFGIDAPHTLYVQPGVTIEVQTTNWLWVGGALEIRGSAGDPVLITSASQVRGSWFGIVSESGASAVRIAHATVEYAQAAVKLTAGQTLTAEISETTIREFTSSGVEVGSNAAVLLDSVVIDNSSGPRSGTGVAVIAESATATIENSTIRGTSIGIQTAYDTQIRSNLIELNNRGIVVTGASQALIERNQIQWNSGPGQDQRGGIQVWGDSDPSIFGNLVAANVPNCQALGERDVESPAISAEGNRWGIDDGFPNVLVLTDGPAIANTIEDRKSTERREFATEGIVDFAPFHDAADEPVPGNFLVGAVDSPTTLPADSSHTVLGVFLVTASGQLTIQEGVELGFVSSGSLEVYGSLDIQGADGNPVVATSTSSPGFEEKGDWKGILLESTVATAQVDYLTTEFMEFGIAAFDSEVVVSNSSFASFGNVGFQNSHDGVAVFIENGTVASAVMASTVDNGDQSGTGISLNNASPHIVGNTLQNLNTGLLARLDSNPLIDGGNTITANKIGIELKGQAPQSTAIPNPVIHGNEIYANAWNGNTQNLLIDSVFFIGTSQVVDATGNYWGSTDPGTILDGIDVNSQSEDVAIPVDASDYLDQGGVPQVGPLFSNLVLSASHTSSTGSFNPVAGELYPIKVEIVAPATVTVLIYDDLLDFEVGNPQFGEPSREMTQAFGSAGEHTINWDGRDDQGAFVPDGAYAYAVVATDGVSPGLYSIPRDPDENFDVSAVSGTNYDAFANEPIVFDVTVVGRPARVNMAIIPGGGSGFNPVPTRALAPGMHTLVWNGRDASGLPTTADVAAQLFIDPKFIRPNYAIVQGVSPEISGGGAAPGVVVKSDPYRVTHSYNQTSTIRYRLDQDCTVTVKLLPPGITDPDDLSAIPLLEDAAQAGAIDHEVAWAGSTPGDPIAIQTADEGAFSFWIEATSAAAPAHSSEFLGVLQLRR